MDDNPYEPPKTESPAYIERPRSPGRSTAAIVFLVVLSIPAGFICGAATCTAAIVGGDAAAQTTGFSGFGIAGAWIGMLMGFAIPAAMPLGIIWLLTRKGRPK